MIYIPPVLELSMFGVLDAGVPNRERVCLRPTDSLNLAQFGLLIGIRQENGAVTPVSDFFYWFGEVDVSPPAWIILFTGKGEPQHVPKVENGKNVYLFYWNLKSTIFDIPRMVPIAFKINNVLIGGNVLPSGTKQIANQ